MNRIPCPSCGEMNYATEPVCWACGTPMTTTPAPSVADTPTEAVPDPPLAVMAQPSTLPGQPRPAELEAASLSEKPYVTPPVDVPERPRTPGEWLVYTGHLVTGTVTGFRESLNEFDRRRCRPSGTFSSASCLATALAFIVVAALMAWLTPMLLGR